jgi:hypothetical protein
MQSKNEEEKNMYNQETFTSQAEGSNTIGRVLHRLCQKAIDLVNEKEAELVSLDHTINTSSCLVSVVVVYKINP